MAIPILVSEVQELNRQRISCSFIHCIKSIENLQNLTIILIISMDEFVNEIITIFTFLCCKHWWICYCCYWFWWFDDDGWLVYFFEFRLRYSIALITLNGLMNTSTCWYSICIRIHEHSYSRFCFVFLDWSQWRGGG